MKNLTIKTLMATVIVLLLPNLLLAQGIADNIGSLQTVLDTLKKEMLEDDMFTQILAAAQSIAGFAALWYIAAKIWRHLAAAEPIDFYPLLKPFAIGLAIMFWPACLMVLDGILQPTVSSTGRMVEDSNQAIKVLLEKKAEAVKQSDHWKMFVGEDGEGDRDKWLRYTYKINDTEPIPNEGFFESLITNDFKFAMAKASYNFRNTVKQWMSEILQVLYQAAALCINTLRTFNLVVLSLLGPFVLALSIFEGLQNSLSAWAAKYINTFLWLPVCNIFGSIIGKVQMKMIAMDITMIGQTGDTFFSSTDLGYLVFLVIGIVGYFTVPTVAGYIVNAGGAGAMIQKITSMAGSAPGSPISAARSGVDNYKSYQDGANNTGMGGTGIAGAVGRFQRSIQGKK